MLSLVSIETNNERFLQFRVSHDYVIQEEIQQFTIHDFEGYLTLIAGVHRDLKNNIGRITNKEKNEIQEMRMSSEIAKQVLAVRQESMRQYNDAVSEWDSERSKMSAQLQRLQSQIIKYETQLNDEKSKIQESIENKYVQIINELRITNDRSQQDSHNKIRLMEENNKQMVEFYKDQINQLQKKTDGLEEKLYEKTVVSKTSAKRGRHAEEEFAVQAAVICGWNCERTADTSHSCDYRATIAGVTVLFELKNYTNIVPTKEVQKFRRDMDEHREVHVGVFITTETEITGMRSTDGLFKIEWSPSGQLLIFITQFNNDIDGNLLLLDRIITTAAEPLLKKTDNNISNEAIIRLERGLKYVEGAQERLRGIINRMMIDKRTAEDNYTQSLMTLKLLKEEMILIFQELSGQIIHTQDEVEKQEEEKPKKRAKKMKTVTPSNDIA
jgi:hypothetical protein